MSKPLLSLLIATVLTGCGGGGSEESTSVVDKTTSDTQPGTNNTSQSETNNSTQTTENSVPNADAGKDLSVNIGEEVTLDGSASSDEDGDALTYSWTIVSGPTKDLTIENSVSPTFTPEIEGEYTIALSVNDGTDTSEQDSVIVTVIKPNTAPVAAIKAQESGKQGEAFLLSAENSFDEEGDPLNYTWSFSVVPETSTLTDDELPQSQLSGFTPDVAGDYIIQLIISDRINNSEAVTHTVTVAPNSAPTVEAEIDITFNFGGEAYIYSNVTDEDSTEFNYLWEITGVPDGSELLGFTYDKSYLAYVPDVAGEYTAKLTVNDGFNEVESEMVTANIAEQYEYRYKIGGRTSYYGKVNEPILLDFAKSTSPNGKPLNYTWALRSAPSRSRPSLSTSIIDKAETEFTGDRAGTYQIFVTAKDDEGYGAVESIYVTLFDSATNMIPESRVENPHFIQLGESITLDGTNSYDAEDDLLTYKWKIAYQPPTSKLEIKDPAAATQLLTPTQPGFYSVQLRTYDGNNGNNVTVSSGWFYVFEEQTDVVAFTDGEIFAKEGETITLNGKNSVGVDETVTVAWDIINAPYNSSSTLTNADTLTPSFDLDVDGKFVFQLRLLQDDEVVSISHLTVRSKENAVPVASAGEDKTAVSGERVTLSGANSSDIESSAITYQWNVISVNGDYNSVPYISGKELVEPTLIVEDSFVGEVVIGLVVSDGENVSVRDEAVINFEAPVAATRLERVSMTSFLPTEVEFPYETNEVIEPLLNEPGDGSQILAIFYLHADHADFTMTNIEISDTNNVVEPILEVYNFNYSTEANEKLDHSEDITIKSNRMVSIFIMSPADTNQETALIDLSFEIAETGETFNAVFEYTSN